MRPRDSGSCDMTMKLRKKIAPDGNYQENLDSSAGRFGMSIQQVNAISNRLSLRV